MDPVTCPRCRTAIQPADGTVRCPACGMRTRRAITANPSAQPKSTGIATGLPAAATPPAEEPESELDLLTAGSRRRRHLNDHLAGGGDEVDRQRIGRLLMLLRLLPVVASVVCVLLLPVVVVATFASLGRETGPLPYVLILVPCVIVALMLGAGYVLLRSGSAPRDDEDTSC
jgi:hypothetical protein